MLLGRSRILYVGPGTLRIAFRRVPRAPMAPHRLLGGCQSCSQTLATLPTCMPWGWVGLEATAELPVSSEEAHTVCEMSTDTFLLGNRIITSYSRAPEASHLAWRHPHRGHSPWQGSQSFGPTQICFEAAPVRSTSVLWRLF